MNTVVYCATSLPRISPEGKAADCTLDAAAEAELKSGGYYINVQSAAFPSGEIRGKLVAQ